MSRKTEQLCRKRRRKAPNSPTTAGVSPFLPQDSSCEPSIAQLRVPNTFPVLSDDDDDGKEVVKVDDDCFCDLQPFKGMRKEHESHVAHESNPTAEQLMRHLPFSTRCAREKAKAEDESKLLVYVEHDASVVFRHPTPSFVVKPKTINFPR